METSDLPDFSGFVLQLSLSNTGASEYAVDSVLLEYPEWRHVGGRLFLVGRMPEVDATSWVAGRETGVAWENVSSYVVFRSREEYRDSAARYRPSLRERLRR